MIVLSDIEQQIADILIEAAMEKRTVSFTEIMRRVGIERRKIGEYLSNIGRKCIELELPIITSIVVYKGTNKVGRGYSEFAPEFANDPQSAILEQDKVWNNKSWEGLLDSVIEPDGVWTNDIAVEEGETKYVKRKMAIRDNRLRNKCLERDHYTCQICGFNAEKEYGKNFSKIIEVHHKDPINEGKRLTTLNDLICVCPNCHRALHSKPGRKPYDTEELKRIINKNKQK